MTGPAVMALPWSAASADRSGTLPIWCGVKAAPGNLRSCSSTRSRSAPGRVAGRVRGELNPHVPDLHLGYHELRASRIAQFRSLRDQVEGGADDAVGVDAVVLVQVFDRPG